MTPVTPMRTVPLDVAEIAVAQADQRGEFALLQSEVRQAVQTFSVQLNNVQAEQEKAREDRMHQLGLLTTLIERSAGMAGSELRVQALESKVGYWRGVFVGFGALATVVAAMSVAWITGQFQANAAERGRLEARIERLENKP